jgi:hypothetical protein
MTQLFVSFGSLAFTPYIIYIVGFRLLYKQSLRLCFIPVVTPFISLNAFLSPFLCKCTIKESQCADCTCKEQLSYLLESEVLSSERQIDADKKPQLHPSEKSNKLSGL